MSDVHHEIRPKRLVFSIFLIILGIVIGITLVSEFRLLPFGAAVNDPQKSKPPAISQAEQTFVEISKSVTPAVVNIATTRVVDRGEEAPGFPFDDPFFRRFFGDEPPRRGQPRERRAQSLGSGVIVDPNGLILTNNHVVEKADEIKVVLGDKREFKGKLIGSDPKTDLAVIRIDAKELPTVSWGDSDKLQVGEYVLAIGNPFGLNQTVTMGIVSAVGRANVGIADYEDFIQTDAAINPGNSGGALVNRRGELVGINTAIFSRTGGYMGIGFAVPSEMAKSIKESLVRTGKVTRGWLGVSIQEVTPQLAKEFGLKESKGALVSDVLPDSPAEAAGIKRSDILLAIDGKEVESTAQLRKWVAGTAVGKKIRLTLFRDKKEKEIELSPGEQPQEVAQAGEEGAEAETSALKGAQVRNLTPEAAREMNLPKGLEGVVISRVEAGSLAEEAGLRAGDVILEVNRTAVRNTREYEKALSGLKKEQGALLLVHRRGNTLFLTLDAA